MCNAAKIKEDGHRRRKHDAKSSENGLPIISLDYQELDEDADTPQKMIVGKDEMTGNIICHEIISKGLTDEWVIKKLITDIEELGRSNIVLKTDGEPAIKAVQSRTISQRKAYDYPHEPAGL